METRIRDIKVQMNSLESELKELYTKTGPDTIDVVLVRSYCFIPSQEVMDRYIELKIETHANKTGHTGTELTDYNKNKPESNCRTIDDILCKECKQKIVSTCPSFLFLGSVEKKSEKELLQVYNEFKPQGLFVEKVDKHYKWKINRCDDWGESLVRADLNFDE